MVNLKTQLAQFRARNRMYRRIGTIVCLTIATLMGLFAMEIGLKISRASTVPPAWILNWLPGIFYLGAVWSLRNLFAVLSKENSPEPLWLTRAIASVGWSLILGSLATTFPIINFILSPPTKSGNFIIFFVPAVTLFVVGLALVALAPILRRKEELELETAALKRELEEFM
jgi:hypothetical protein